MKHIILLLTFIGILFGDEIDEVSPWDVSPSSESEPLAIVAGCVNAVTGNYFQVETDLMGNTIDPLKIIRFYDSQSKLQTSLGLGFGTQYPLIATGSQKEGDYSYALINEREGSFLTYEGDFSSHAHKKLFQVDPRILKKGFTNTSGGEISGKANLKNWKAELTGKESWVVKLGDGSKRIYGKKIHLSESNKRKLRIPTDSCYLLTQEIKPNGNSLVFEYGFKSGSPYLTKIKTINRTHSHVLNEISIQADLNGYMANSSCGSHVIYQNKKVNYKSQGEIASKNLLTYVSTGKMGHCAYGFDRFNDSNRWVIKTVHKLQGYHQRINYNGSKKVSSLIHTVGPNNEPIETHKFRYEKGHTVVTDCLDRNTTFFYDKYKRVTKIEYPDRNDIFLWGTDKGKDGWLKSKQIASQRGIHHKKVFEYDNNGNVTLETIFGNITGLKNDTFNNENETDYYSLKHEYTFFNLPSKTIHPNGLVIQYEYLPNTNLKTVETHAYNGKIQERFFRTYDENGEVSEITEDDGSGLSSDDYTDAKYRRLTLIKAIAAPNSPAFGKPEVEEKYYVRIHERDRYLLTRTMFAYDVRGNLTDKTIYDSEGNLCSKISKIYDENNRISQETDPLGHVTKYQYDFNGNKIKEESVSTQTVISYAYNSVNKLIRKTESYPDAGEFITLFYYNPLGEKTKETDPFGNDTLFAYDTFGNVIEIIYPPISNDKHPTVKRAYNALGQLISETNENQQTTTYSRNIFGNPVKITYPNGACEHHFYSLSGLLQKTVKADGAEVTYQHDPKGRIIKKEIRDSDHILYEREEFVYKGPLLMYKTDFAGLTTHYYYDPAGRLIGTKCLDKVITYELDDLGRNKRVIEGSRVTSFAYDPMGNVLSCAKEDLSGRSYSLETFKYDLKSNQIEKSTEIQEGIFASSYKSYYADNTIKCEQDEEGNQTFWNYNRCHKNSLNQNVLEVTKKDPLNRLSISTYDALHNCVKEEISENGKILYSKEIFYNDARLPINSIVHVLDGGEPVRTYTVQKKYDSMNRLEQLIEENDKATRFAYDPVGRLTKKILPDGTSITLTYDPLGRCLSKQASDQSISYKYEYDAHGNLIHTHDLVNDISLTKTYDLLDQLVQEEFLHNALISYHYDLYGRVSQMTLPNGSKVAYSYSPYHLKTITRLDSSGSSLYQIETQYDKTGRLLETNSPACSTNYLYDKLGRTVSISSPFYESHYTAYDPCSNLLSETITTPKTYTSKNYRYDSLNQLIEEPENTFTYDSIGNCSSRNGIAHSINKHNQLIQNSQYSTNGHLTQDTLNTYQYDALGRLTQLNNTPFTYDGSNRCLEIGPKTLLYQVDIEIGSLINNQLSEFRLVQNEHTFAIEIDGTPYFVQQDARHNIVLLHTTQPYTYSTFEENIPLSPLSPWRFANRRQIDHLTLFTHRIYNQNTHRWLTPDPLSFADGPNLYRYNRNNPSRYFDTDGRFALALPLVFAFDLGVGITAVSLPTLYACTVAAGAATLYYGAKAYDQRFGTHIAPSLFQPGLYVMNTEVIDDTAIEEKTDEVKDLSSKYPVITHDENGNKTRQKTIDIYAPDKPLTEKGDRILNPTTNDPHTQLGTVNGSKGKYTKAREFGYNGVPIRDIEFTDHGRAHDHTCPHQHKWIKNPTGGSYKRGDPEPLEGWPPNG